MTNYLSERTSVTLKEEGHKICNRHIDQVQAKASEKASDLYSHLLRRCWIFERKMSRNCNGTGASSWRNRGASMMLCFSWFGKWYTRQNGGFPAGQYCTCKHLLFREKASAHAQGGYVFRLRPFSRGLQGTTEVTLVYPQRPVCVFASHDQPNFKHFFHQVGWFWANRTSLQHSLVLLRFFFLLCLFGGNC
jgi:hypothetical protein